MADQPCQAMEFGEDSFVCVCDRSDGNKLCHFKRGNFRKANFFSSYCDEPDPVVVPPTGQVRVFNGVSYGRSAFKFPMQLLHVTSSASGDRFRSETLDWDSRPSGGDDGRLALEVDASDRRQEIFGWGGAFTDAATMVIDTMDEGAQEQV